MDAETLIDLRRQFDGGDGAESDIAEVGRDAEIAVIDDTGNDVGQLLLEHIERCCLLGRIIRLRFGLRQGTLVHFLVLIQGNGIDLHRHGRHHIRRFLIHDEGIERLDIDLLIADDICGDELTTTRIVKGLDGRILDAFELTNDSFDFFELDTETADLDLSILAADELDLAVMAVTHDIAGAINTFAVPLNEGLSGLLRLVKVAQTDLRTRNEQFACCTPRHTMTVLIDDEQLRRIVRVTDRDVGFVLLYPITAYIDRCFRRTVAVLQRITRRIKGHQFFTSGA